MELKFDLEEPVPGPRHHIGTGPFHCKNNKLHGQQWIAGQSDLFQTDQRTDRTVNPPRTLLLTNERQGTAGTFVMFFGEWDMHGGLVLLDAEFICINFMALSL